MKQEELFRAIAFLEEIVNENRIERINYSIQNRTKYITVVLENIFQAQNASAVIRSCDCFGIQNLHVIENTNKYVVNPKVAMGASKWVNLFRYNKNENNSLAAISTLKEQGYRIVATSPHKNDVLLPEFDITKGKSAFFFGTELTGLSDIVMNHADEFVKIPMYGFSESFNISVSAALILNHLTTALRLSNVNWQLQKQDKLELKLEWLKKSIQKGDRLLEEQLKRWRIQA